MSLKYGFIILRHVNNELTNKYWISCINSIRKYYPENNILIIDDNSDYEYVIEDTLYKTEDTLYSTHIINSEYPKKGKLSPYEYYLHSNNYEYIRKETLYKTFIINSEYPKRGELLPYYYYLENKLFDVAVILHDSVIINKHNDFKVEKYKFLWDFGHTSDQTVNELKMLNVFNNLELNNFYKNKHLWRGCFGGMSIITHDYLTYINKKYDISKLLKCIHNRPDRCCFERVIACLLQKDEKKDETLFGDIIRYCEWGIKFNDIDKYKHLPLIKHWSGR